MPRCDVIVGGDMYSAYFFKWDMTVGSIWSFLVAAFLAKFSWQSSYTNVCVNH